MNSWYEPSGPGAMTSTNSSYGAPTTSYSTQPSSGQTAAPHPGLGSYGGGQISTAYPGISYNSSQSSAYYPGMVSYGTVGSAGTGPTQQSTSTPSADGQDEPSSRGLFADRLSAFSGSGVDKSKDKPNISRGAPPVIDLEPSYPPQQRSANGTT